MGRPACGRETLERFFLLPVCFLPTQSALFQPGGPGVYFIERRGYGEKTYRYKVSGKVAFFVDDIVRESPEAAKKEVRVDIEDDLSFAAKQGNIEILELNAENLGPCDKDKFYETREC